MNEDSSWIQAPLCRDLYSWTPQKQSLAREVHELTLMNKGQSRELARALERSQQLETSLQASNRAHRGFQSFAEKTRHTVTREPAVHLVQQWAEQNSASMQRELGAAREKLAPWSSNLPGQQLRLATSSWSRPRVPRDSTTLSS